MKNQNQTALINAGQAFVKIHLSASKDPQRHAMQYVQFSTNPEGPQGPAGMYAVATDAHTLFWLNVAEVLSNPEILPAQFYIHADQYKKLTGSKVYLIGCNQDAKTIQTMDKARNTLDVLPYLDPEAMHDGPGRYPDWISVLPTSTEHQLTGGQIGISPKLIGRASQIMDAGPWRLTFRDATKCAIIEYDRQEQHGTAAGLIMPCTILSPDAWKDCSRIINLKLTEAHQKAQDRRTAEGEE
jgi:hypothetical protein